MTAKPADFRIDDAGAAEAPSSPPSPAPTASSSGSSPTAGVRSDPALLRRILQNFLGNAVRYTPRGRMLLGCRRGDDLRIEVWDTGVGIPADKLQEIFIEFQQLDDAPPERGKGLGLGLAIVERLAASWVTVLR